MYERRKNMEKKLNQKGIELLDDIVETKVELDELLSEIESEK